MLDYIPAIRFEQFSIQEILYRRNLKEKKNITPGYFSNTENK
jgi:hypothetical protein